MYQNYFLDSLQLAAMLVSSRCHARRAQRERRNHLLLLRRHRLIGEKKVTFLQNISSVDAVVPSRSFHHMPVRYSVAFH